MSGYIVRIGKRHFAFGLLWAQLPGVERARKEIKKLAQDHEAADFVSFSVDSKRVMIGLLPRASIAEKGASRSKALAAGAALATVYKGKIGNAVFGIALPSNRIAIIGFRDGIPLVGFDKVVLLQAVEGVVADYLKVLKEQASTVVFYGSDAIFQGRNPSPFGLEWFATADASKLTGTSLRRVKKPFGLVFAVIAVLGAIGYGVVWYEQYQEEQVKKARSANVDPNPRYEQSVAALLTSAGYPTVEVAWQMIEAINRLPMYHQGWRLDRASCTPGSCTLIWSNGDGGTYQSFAAAALPGVTVQKTTYKEGMFSIETGIAYTVVGKQGVNLPQVPKLDDFIFSFGTRAQQLKDTGIVITLEKANTVGIPPSPAGQPSISESQLKNLVKEGSWTMKGDWLFFDALRSMPSNMTIQSLDVEVAGEAISMTVTGKYYVKK